MKNNVIRKLVSLSAAGALTVALLAGCGNTPAANTPQSSAAPENVSDDQGNAGADVSVADAEEATGLLK